MMCRERVRSVPFVIVAIISILGLGTSAHAVIIHDADYNWQHDGSGEMGFVNVQVNDNGAGVYSWLYTLTNINFNPTFDTNGASGFHINFGDTIVPELANQFAPSGWTLNGFLLFGQPNSVSFDIDNFQGFGIMPGGVGTFGFDTAPRAIALSGDDSTIHTWILHSHLEPPVSQPTFPADFGLAVPGQTVPEPATMTLMGLGLAGFALRRRKMNA